MTGMSDKARHEKAMHEQVAEMYRRRARYRFAVDFQRERNEILMSLTPTARDAVALDLGCGTGITLLELSERYDRVVGVDLSREMLDGFDASDVEPGRSVSIAQADSLRVGAGFAAGLIATAAALALAASGLTRLLKRLPLRRFPYGFRQGVANLFRPRNHTLPTTIAIGYGMARHVIVEI